MKQNGVTKIPAGMELEKVFQSAEYASNSAKTLSAEGDEDEIAQVMHGGKRMTLDEDSSIEEGELNDVQKQQIKNDLINMYGDEEEDDYGVEEDEDSDVAEAAATQ